MRKHKNIILTSAIAVVLLCCSILLYIIFYADLKDSTSKVIEKQQKQLTEIAVNEIERQLYDLQKRIEIIATDPIVREAQRGEACNQHLQKLVELNSLEFNNLGRVDKDGAFVCAVNRTVIGEPVSKYGDYFERVKSDPKHQPALSRLIIPTGSANPVMALHVAVFDDRGQFNGTIGGAIYFDELQKQLLASTKLTQNTVVVLYDDNLDVLYNPDPLIRGKNLNSPEVKRLYTTPGSLEQFIERIKQTPGEGTIEYSFRDQPRRATYKSANILGRYWTAAVIVPSVDIQNAVSYQTAQGLYIGISSLFVVAGTALTYLLLRSRRSKVVRQK